MHVPASDLSSVVFLLVSVKPMKMCPCVRAPCPVLCLELCAFDVSVLRAGALAGKAEERALHERERHAPQRAAGPQRLHVSAALGHCLCSLPPPHSLFPTNGLCVVILTVVTPFSSLLWVLCREVTSCSGWVQVFVGSPVTRNCYFRRFFSF